MTPRTGQDTGSMDAVLNTPEIWQALLPAHSRDVHKYHRGHCLVVSGSELQTGASRLAATAALNNGAGAVSITGNRAALRIHATQVTSIMLKEATTPVDFAMLLATGKFDAVIIGPAAGVGVQTFARIQAIQKTGLPFVLDADSLTAMTCQLRPFGQTDAKTPTCVMTPHAGEFANLFAPLITEDGQFKALSVELQQSKVEQARAAARIANSIIVFKGFDTVIAAPDGRAILNNNAGPELATAGSGDVLSGLIGAHLAGGMPPFEAAAAAVWLHGYLGAQIGIGLTADRLVERVRPLAAFLSNNQK